MHQNRTVKTTSAGILILNPQAELLLCHVTGTSNWDIPKGGIDPGETPEQAAIRETCEETGLCFSPADLIDLGCFSYRPVKDLHLYATMLERIDTTLCHCSTRYRDRTGRMRPEMDGYGWAPFAVVAQRCAKSLAILLTESVPLQPLFERLRAEGHAVQRMDAVVPA